MAKRMLAFPVENGVDELRAKRAKLSEPIHETDTIESISPSNYNPSDGANEFSSESEHEGHTFSFETKSKRNLRPVDFSDIAMSNRKKPICKSKNAVMARINRIKKKYYIEGLEMKTAQLEVENKELRGNLDLKTEEIATLKREVLHLKNIIRNRTEIGSLLKCIHQNTDLKITSSILGAPNTSQVSQSSVPMNDSKNTIRSPTNKLTFWSSDEEGKTPVYSNNSPSHSVINDNQLVGNAFLSKKKLLDELSFDHDPQLDHDYFAEPETKVSRFEMESPNCLLPEFGSELDDFNRCDTPTKGTHSEFGSYFADEDLGFNLGICLHVANKQVSLEFCDSCNHKASLLT